MNLPIAATINATSQLTIDSPQVVAVMSGAKTDQQLIDTWLHDRPAKTLKTYQECIDQFWGYHAYKSLRHVTVEDVQAFITHLSQKGLSDATIRQRTNTIKSLFSYGTKLGYFQINITTVIKIRKAPNSFAKRTLSREDITSMLLAHCSDRPRYQLRNSAFIKFLYATGCRISEACNVTWNDLQLRSSGQAQALITGKGNKERTVLLPLNLYEALQQLKGTATPSDRVFSIAERQGHNIVKVAAAAAGLSEDISAHWLRHSNATHAADAGCPIHVIRDNHGHSSLAVTSGYISANPDNGTSKYLGL